MSRITAVMGFGTTDVSESVIVETALTIKKARGLAVVPFGFAERIVAFAQHAVNLKKSDGETLMDAVLSNKTIRLNSYHH